MNRDRSVSSRALCKAVRNRTAFPAHGSRSSCSRCSIFWSYVPYAVLTRYLAMVSYAPLGRALTGLEVLPATTMLSGLLTFAFVGVSGWWREAHQARFLGHSIPRPTRWTLLSGVGTSLLLFTVPLSFTFPGVSIPFMQLLMRGDVRNHRTAR